MSFKTLLKTTLAVAVLGGSSMAYAQETTTATVTLADKETKVPWSTFVKAINDPNSIEGKASEALVKAWEEAQTDSINALDALKTVKTKLDEYVKATAAAEKLYNDSVAYIPTLQTKLSDLRTKRTTANENLTKATGQYQTAKIDYNQAETKYETASDKYDAAVTATATAKEKYDDLQTEYANLPKKTVTGLYDWLQKVNTPAQDLATSGENADAVVYWAMGSYTYLGKENPMLLVTYRKKDGEAPEPSTADKVTQWEHGDLMEFNDYIMRLTSWPKRLAVYLGPGYKAASGLTADYLVFNGTTPNDTESLIQTSAAAIKGLTTDPTYLEEKKTDEYANPSTAANYKEVLIPRALTAWENAKKAESDALAAKTTAETTKNTAQSTMDGYDSQVKTLEGQVSGLDSQITPLQAEIDERNANLPAKKQAWDDAKAAEDAYNTESVEPKQAAADAAADAAVKALAAAAADAENNAAIAKENYTEVFLNGDITLTSAADCITRGTGVIIDGQGHVLTNATGAAFIQGTFSGELHNVAVNGAFSSRNSNAATFGNVVYNNGSIYRVYNDLTTPTDYNSLGELGYNARTVAKLNYGVDFANNRIVRLTAESTEFTVYSITTYDNGATATTPAGTQESFYVTDNGSEFITEGAASVNLGDNIFAVSADKIATEISNVIYPDGKNMVCDNVELKDLKNFYCPVQFRAAKFVYNRAFKKGFNSVCLPVSLSSEFNAAIDYVADYDTETPTKFWFNTTDKTEPNTPVLLSAKNDFNNIEIEDVIVNLTPANQIVVGGTNDESYGTFKNATRDTFAGASNGYKVYALNNATGKFQASSSSTFNPFRMILMSNTATPTGQNAPRAIGVRDENGKEITVGSEGGDTTVGIDEVANDSLGLNVKGGVGEIIFTADADHGKVDIFTLDGRRAGVANVTEGTTTVSLGSGLYIVMGQKVIVK
nr:hypothetical protein [Bacteroides sp.]